MLLEPFYSVLNTVFGPIVNNYSPFWVILAAGIIVSTLITLVNYVMVDNERRREIQDELKNIQNEQDLKSGGKKAKQSSDRMMSLQKEMMKMTFKPMLVYWIPIIIFFRWLLQRYAGIVIIHFPFTIPGLATLHNFINYGGVTFGGSQLGFMGWYILTTMFVSQILRKALDMQ